MQFNPKSGRYHDESGSFVARSEILRLLDSEAARLEIRLQGHARLLANGKLNVAEFQERMAVDLKLSHLRSGMLAAGGKEQMDARRYGAVGAELKRQYKYLAGFGTAIANGELSEKQIINRAKMYGISTRVAFFKVEKVSRKDVGVTEAKRDLDSSAKHCPSCLRHSTYGKFVSVDEITPPGTDCECQARCRCRVVYRKLSDALPTAA
jgi:hypothetical protein